MSLKEKNEQLRYVSDVLTDMCWLPYEAWVSRVRKQGEVLEESYKALPENNPLRKVAEQMESVSQTSWQFSKPNERLSSYWDLHDAYAEAVKQQQRTFFHLFEEFSLRSLVR